jgi:alpha-mannosidase
MSYRQFIYKTENMICMANSKSFANNFSPSLLFMSKTVTHRDEFSLCSMNILFRLTIVCAAIFIFSANLIAQSLPTNNNLIDDTGKLHLYYANDTHTDVMWNNNEADYEKMILEMTDWYLNMNEGSRNKAYEYRNKWNFDCSYWLWVLEHKTDSAYFARIIQQVKDSLMSVPYNFVLPTFGATPAEAVIRGMYYSGYLERKFGLKISTSTAQENTTIPLGLASLWKGSGVQYSWKGVCNCASKVKSKGRRANEMYWYTGADSSRVLMKWYSNMIGWSGDIGGYSECLEPRAAIDKLDTICNKPRYPYRIAAAFGKGWDNMVNYSYDFLYATEALQTNKRKVIISNEWDFFEDFEKHYGNVTPAENLAYGNEWDFLSSSLATVSARFRRVVEKMRVAEAMASIVAVKHPHVFDNLNNLKQKANLALSMYWLHGWTADGPVKREKLAAWSKEKATDAEAYVDSLYNQSLQWLGKMITVKNKQSFMVFNPLGWQRTDVAELLLNDDKNIIIKDANKKTVPHQVIIKEGKRYAQFIAEKIPSAGYKTFYTEAADNAEMNIAGAIIANNIENDFYTVTVNNAGAIISLKEKQNGKEWIQAINGKYTNDFGVPAANGKVSIINSGAISTTIQCISSDSLKKKTLITLFKKLPRIEIQNNIQQNFANTISTAFSFNISNPTVWHEEIGAVINARLKSHGGHYADSFARYDWLSMQHFANMGNGESGITISNLDGNFMQLGNSTVNKLDENTPQINVLLGGQMDNNLGIFKQGGDSLFVQTLALLPHQNTFDQTQSMRFALEHQTPLVTSFTNGGNELPADNFSFLSVDNKEVMLWALKPAEDGVDKAGIVTRFWNMSKNSLSFTITTATNIGTASHCTHIETAIEKLPVVKNKLSANIGFQQMKTWELMIK